jgi:hypothetical protein
MTFKKQNPWKYLSVGLLGVIAIGLLTPIDAIKPEPKENEATEVDCENPCIDETELTFDTATQAELDILDGTVAGLIFGTVTQVNTGSGLTGGPITASGTISVDNGGITGTHIATGTIESSNVKTSFMKFVRLVDDTAGNTAGWDPNGSTKLFTITESSIVHTGTKMSVVAISLNDNDFSLGSIPTCSVVQITEVSDGSFKIGCNNPPTNGAVLGYVVINS